MSIRLNVAAGQPRTLTRAARITKGWVTASRCPGRVSRLASQSPHGDTTGRQIHRHGGRLGIVEPGLQGLRFSLEQLLDGQPAPASQIAIGQGLVHLGFVAEQGGGLARAQLRPAKQLPDVSVAGATCARRISQSASSDSSKPKHACFWALVRAWQIKVRRVACTLDSQAIGRVAWAGYSRL